MTNCSIFDRWRSAFLDRKIVAPIRDGPELIPANGGLGGVELDHANRGDEP
jgi:hypothetical protein